MSAETVQLGPIEIAADRLTEAGTSLGACAEAFGFPLDEPESLPTNGWRLVREDAREDYGRTLWLAAPRPTGRLMMNATNRDGEWFIGSSGAESK